MNNSIDRNRFEYYKRCVKFASSAVIVLLEWVLYYYVWMNYYNNHMEISFWRRGNWLIMGEYLIILLLLHQLYGGLKVGIYRYWTLVYSHMISLVGVNAFSYVQVVLFDKKMHSPEYFMVLTAAEFLIVMLWAFSFKKVYSILFPRKRLLLVFGNDSMDQLILRMETRGDKYQICEEIPEQKPVDEIMQKGLKYDGILIGDISDQMRNTLIKRCFQDNVRSYTVPKLSDILLRTSDELNIFDMPLYLSRNIDGLAWDQQFFKRVTDIVIASLGLIITGPFFLIIAFLIKRTDNGPVFYTQQRLTIGGKVFPIYKFRTMVVDAEKLSGAVKAGEKDPRILPVGRFLRATRLDELPQLLNILKGDMSLVGPRPERPELEEIICSHIPEFRYRLKVKAGLTGYAQIYGKYCTTSYDKLKLDLTYIRNYSFWLDMKLIIMTPKVLFMKESTDGFEEGKWDDPALKRKEDRETL